MLILADKGTLVYIKSIVQESLVHFLFAWFSFNIT